MQILWENPVTKIEFDITCSQRVILGWNLRGVGFQISLFWWVEDKFLINGLFSKNNLWLKISSHIFFQHHIETKLHLDLWHMTYIQYISISLLKKHITNWIECQLRNTMPDHLCDAPCCTIYSTILFDLDIMSRHLKLEMPNTYSFPGNCMAKSAVVDHESKKS